MMGTPRRFQLERVQDVTGVSGEGLVAHGVVWPDGEVTLRWAAPPFQTTVHHVSVESVLAIHGHGGATQLAWLDE